MKDIISAMVLYDDPDPWWLKTRYFRRGRIVEWLATKIARDEALPDESWWADSSGWPPGDSRHDPKDWLPHEECRPYLGSAAAYIAEHDFVLEQYQLVVHNAAERYQGH